MCICDHGRSLDPSTTIHCLPDTRWHVVAQSGRQSPNSTEVDGSARAKDATAASNNLHHDKATNDSIVLKGLNQLRSTARSVAQFVEAGRWLKKATLLHQQLVAVVERIVRATALTGLLQLSVRLVDQYFAETPPPMPCQDALAQGLRQAGRVSTLERPLRQWASQSQQRPEAYCVSPIAFSTYLAALWDIFTDRDIVASQRSETSAAAQPILHKFRRRTSLILFIIVLLRHPTLLLQKLQAINTPTRLSLAVAR